MARNVLETVMGAVVLAVAIGFLLFAYERSAVKTIDGYAIEARFSDITGIGLGTDVRVGGLKVGTVASMKLDEATYQATLVMQIRENVKLPKDSSAAIVSSGLLGDKFVKLEPGGDDAMLAAGDTIHFTQSSVSFEELIGKFVFSDGGIEGKDGASESVPAASEAPAAPPSEGGDAEQKPNPFNLGL